MLATLSNLPTKLQNERTKKGKRDQIKIESRYLEIPHRASLEKYRCLSIYKEIVNNLQKCIETLIELNKNRHQQVLYCIKTYLLSNDNKISSICYKEKNWLLNFHIAQYKSPMFLNVLYKNYGHYAANLHMSFFENLINLSTKIQSVYL